MLDGPIIYLLQSIAAASLTVQGMIFIAFIALTRLRTSPQFIAAAVFFTAVVLAAGDTLFAHLGGFLRWPETAFVLSPVGILCAPALFLFVQARIDAAFRLRPIHLLHLTVVAPIYAGFASEYYFLSAEDKLAYLRGGIADSFFYQYLFSLFGQAVMVGYLAASLVQLHRYGMRLKNWFSSLEDRSLNWLRYLVLIKALVIALDFVWHISGQTLTDSSITQWSFAAVLATQLGLINLIMLRGVADHAVHRDFFVPALDDAIPPETSKQLEAVYRQAEQAMMSHRLYLQPGLTLQDLADALKQKPRLVSEAIKQSGESNFLEFVNRHRVEAAKAALSVKPGNRIIDVAYDAGFNSKSAFNQAFRKYVGQTPSSFRQAIR
jgi:AraC-like DNA-binding protein